MRQGLALLLPIVIGLALVGVVIGSLVRHPDPGRRVEGSSGWPVPGWWPGSAASSGCSWWARWPGDPGGWTAAWLIAAFVIPLAACCLLAWRLPDAGTWLLAVLTAALLAVDVWVAISPGALRDVEDRTGPVQAVAIFAVAAAVAVLGLRRTRAAGIDAGAPRCWRWASGSAASGVARPS